MHPISFALKGLFLESLACAIYTARGKGPHISPKRRMQAVAKGAMQFPTSNVFGRRTIALSAGRDAVLTLQP